MDLSKLAISVTAIALSFVATQIKFPDSSELLSTQVKSIRHLSQDLSPEKQNKSTLKIELVLFVPAKDISYFLHK